MLEQVPSSKEVKYSLIRFASEARSSLCLFFVSVTEANNQSGSSKVEEEAVDDDDLDDDEEVDDEGEELVAVH